MAMSGVDANLARDLRVALLEGHIDPTLALQGLADVLDELVRGHGRDVVHLDIEPRHIFINARGLFELPMVETQGASVYAAPELRADPDRVDARADLYSMGMTVLFVLTGEDPPRLPDRAYVQRLPCSKKLAGALLWAVMNDPELRNISCNELAQLLRHEARRGVRQGDAQVWSSSDPFDLPWLRACAIVTAGAHIGRSLQFTEEPLTIGRDHCNAFQIDERKVSRRHAEIQMHEGVALLRDLGSTNGTLVNGKNVRGTVHLQDHDLIQIGRTKLWVIGPCVG